MLLTLLWSSALAACATAKPTRPQVRLRYAAHWRTRCPHRDALQRAVRERLGYNPWRELARREVAVRIDPAGEKLVARTDLTDRAGKPVGTRQLEVQKGRCGQLIDALALAITLAIDPLAAQRRQARSKPPKPKRPQLWLALGGVATLGASPHIAATPRGQVALRWPTFSLALEGTASLPDETSVAGVDGAKVRVWSAGGALLGCYHVGPVFGCGMFVLSSMVGSSEGLAEPATEALPHLAGGGRAGVELKLHPKLLLRFYEDLVFPMVNVKFTDHAETRALWTAPAVAGGFGADLAAHLF